MRITKLLISLVGALLFLSASAPAQQDYVARYDAFGSYSFLDTPKLNLFERGFNGQFGVNVRRWLAIGGDFSVFTGHSTLYPHMLAPAKQQELGAKLQPLVLAGIIPPTYQVYSMYDATTYTFTAGPQLNYRHFKWVTLFIHPSIGGLHQAATAKPNLADPIQVGIVKELLGPSMKKSELVLFAGIGGGIDLNVSKHVHLRMATDIVHTDLFSGLLNGGQNNVRFSVGPTFSFGRNVEK